MVHTILVIATCVFFSDELKEIVGLTSPSSLPMPSEASDSKKDSDKSVFKDFIKTCYENEDSRKIAIFLLINLLFMIVELVYGFLSNSLGLITDSFHMLFDCTALFISLCASYIATLKADKEYTYGYLRAETLSGLFNGIFLVFIAFNVFCESVERIFEPQHIETSGLLAVSIAGFIVNLIGLVFFHDHAHHDHDHGHSHHGEEGHDHDHSHDHSHSHGHSHDH